MSFRRLFAPLLLLPLLLGVSVQRFDVRAAPDGDTTFIAVDAITAGPALPGSAASIQLSIFESSAPVRAHERNRSFSAVPERTACTAARAASLDRDFLGYARDLDHARLVIPITCGNPPPASAS